MVQPAKVLAAYSGNKSWRQGYDLFLSRCMSPGDTPLCLWMPKDTVQQLVPAFCCVGSRLRTRVSGLSAHLAVSKATLRILLFFF